MVRSEFGHDDRVQLLRIANGGKANALNVGVAHAKGDVIVALDADTQFARTTISRLVRWFADPKVGAVAGNAKVGNRVNTITRWQALEYIVAQNLERRALAALGTLTVVPGAVGAWRKSALQEVGGYPTDTLAEDQDLTIHLQGRGYKVRFDSTAIAWTEAPNSFAGLARQRFRWAYGTLQCLWKYRGFTFNPRYGALGMIALPQVWLFQIILTALAPLADLLLVWQLIGQGIAYLQHGAEFSNDNLEIVGVYYAIFMVVDLTAALIGFLMERREDWTLLWWLMLQRFGYRQLMYYVVVRSIWTAIKGPFVGWGKLERTGMVQGRAVLTRHEEDAFVIRVIDAVGLENRRLDARPQRKRLERVEFHHGEIVRIDPADEIGVRACTRRELLAGVEDVDFRRLARPIAERQRFAERAARAAT